ncbi:MAG TPA: hypothetical protein DDW65_12790, partial [Firmicutes bacterium]|nr:hypothetical protein [Bacillota bacterium]
MDSKRSKDFGRNFFFKNTNQLFYVKMENDLTANAGSVMKRGIKMAKPAILVQNLIRDFDTFRAVDDISLEVQRGTNLGILGPPKAGKTTFIRLILGLIAPTSGQIEV